MTVDGAKAQVKSVLDKLGKTGYGNADPLAWAQSQGQGLFESEDNAATNATSSSNTRQLADALKSLAKSSGTTLTPATPEGTVTPTVVNTIGAVQEVTSTSYKRTALVPAGLYIIVDESTTNPSVPMIVGTAPYRLSNGTVADGTINMKNGRTPTTAKKSISGDGSADIGQNDKKTVTIKVTMPQIANYTTYDFDIYDFVDPGMTVDTSTIKVTGSIDADHTKEAEYTVSTIARAKENDKYIEDVTGDATTTSNNHAGSEDSALDIHLNYTQLKALSDAGVSNGKDIIVTYKAWLNQDVLKNDSTGVLLGTDADGKQKTSKVHAAKNSVRVSNNGTKSAPADAATAGSVALLSTSDFSFSKVWADTTPAAGAKFTVSKVTKDDSGKDLTEYLQGKNSDGEWSWKSGDANKHEFSADDAQNGNIFTFQGLADGGYTVTESTSPTGANPALKPSFTVTIGHTASNPAQASTTVSQDPWGLVLTAMPGDSNQIARVTNVRSVSELPKTGAAGIILAVAVAILLFAGAFLLVSIYRRKAAARR